MFSTIQNKAIVALIATLLITSMAALVLRSQRDQARAELANYQTEIAVAIQKATETVRAQETQLRKAADKVNHETATRLQAATRSAADAHRTADSLRTTLANLNASQAPADPEAARYLEQARTARQLLGTCADRYASVAEDADRLAVQVSGLQAWSNQVCGVMTENLESE